MAEIRPFRGLRYTDLAGPLQKLIAPPYDVLTPAQRTSFAAQSPYNIVHLTLPEGRPDDRSKFVKYGRSAALLNEWRREEILGLEPAPSLYRYRQTFESQHGTRITRTSLITLLKLEPFSTGTVLPHEETFPKHKEDRLRLLEATRAHLESIFGLYEDPDGSIQAAIEAAPLGPAVSADVEHIGHLLEPIADGEATIRIASLFKELRIWIADGHHRYETALAFREALGPRDLAVAEDYIVIALTSVADPGLVLLPTHRVVPGLRGIRASELVDRLRERFHVEPQHASHLFRRIADLAAEGQRAFGMAVEGGNGFVLTPLDEAALAAVIGGERSARLKGLDVTILHEAVFPLLGVDRSALIDYYRDEDAALRATEGGAGPTFLMLPPSVEDMKEIALAGERMPQKSTYYYPKIFSGLVLWSLADF